VDRLLEARRSWLRIRERGMQVHRSGRMLGCPPAGSETSMASRACAWCAARSRMREENVLVGYSRGDVSVDRRGERMLMVTARWRSD
jgi:hypothetical protein